MNLEPCSCDKPVKRPRLNWDECANCGNAWPPKPSPEEVLLSGLRADILEKIREMEPDALRTMLYLAERLMLGQRAYGKLDLKTDPRNWKDEQKAEIGDLLVYFAFEELKRQLSPVGAIEARELGKTVCHRPPAGWYCTREAHHEGPCAAHPRSKAELCLSTMGDSLLPCVRPNGHTGNHLPDSTVPDYIPRPNTWDTHG
jgi:hypothetical protein